MRLFDMHCDTLYECYTKGVSLVENSLHIDLQRGRRYPAWAQVFAVWMPDTLRGEGAFQQCRAILQMAQQEENAHPEQFRIVRCGADLQEAWKNGCCAAILAVEGGSALAGELSHIKDLAELGVKILTLTWNGSNELGHGSGSGCENGLTPFGKAVLAEIQSLGILPDVSHLNERGFWDVVEFASGPFIASHSVSASVHPHHRNLTDAQFAAIRDSGGLVGLNLCADHLGEQSFSCFERHLERYLSLGGERTVGLGCDFDGTSLPEEWGGIQVMEKLYSYLCRKNYDETLLDRLFFGNCSDFFKVALTSGTDCISMKKKEHKG